MTRSQQVQADVSALLRARNLLLWVVTTEMRLTVIELSLIKEALKLGASRHAAQARWVAKHKVVPTVAEREHEVKAERMLDLRCRLRGERMIEVY